MSVIVFGNGPLPTEPDFPVSAPGSRTWQIVRGVADGIAASGPNEEIHVVGLDDTPRPAGSPGIKFSIPCSSGTINAEYIPLQYDDFKLVAANEGHDVIATRSPIRAVVGTASIQPCSTAAEFAASRNLPLWIDVFGDSLCEIQSQAEIMPADDAAAYQTRLIHVWKLLTGSLIHGDQFSALSQRQRYALLGQLGCAGRLNQATAEQPIAHAIPYAIYEDDLAPPPPTSDAPRKDDAFTVLWCGSFNTWMDVPALTRGLTEALKNHHSMRLIVVGGQIPGYNELSYRQFVQGIKEAGVEGLVTLMDWQPISKLSAVYATCDVGISIDRVTYEAELGSRTRLINFLAAGVPVISTVVTELTEQLQHDGFLRHFNLNDPASLTEALLQCASNRDSIKDIAARSRAYVLERFNGKTANRVLTRWIQNPLQSNDKLNTESDTNALTKHQAELLRSLN